MLINYSNTNSIKYTVGLDEVGRGCLAGPVVTAGVMLPNDFYSDLIMDSKKLTEKKREAAYELIIKEAIAYSVTASSVKRINKVGINSAIYESMHKNLYEINTKQEIEHYLVDGNQWVTPKDLDKPHDLVPKGDATYLSIAAASILAKVERDRYMVKLSEHIPGYNFENSKGYTCKKHDQGLLDLGPTDYHRTLYVETRLNNLKAKVN